MRAAWSHGPSSRTVFWATSLSWQPLCLLEHRLKQSFQTRMCCLWNSKRPIDHCLSFPVLKSVKCNIFFLIWRGCLSMLRTLHPKASLICLGHWKSASLSYWKIYVPPVKHMCLTKASCGLIWLDQHVVIDKVGWCHALWGTQVIFFSSGLNMTEDGRVNTALELVCWCI